MKKYAYDNEEPSKISEIGDHTIVEHTIYNNGESPIPAPTDLDPSTSLQVDFDFDIFQIEAIKAVNTGNSVLVVASTSAGKSVIAYHSIAESMKTDQISVYTAPVKSLANQKYIELSNKFEDVGLITGDVTTDNSTTSKCLVMTAEVLRNQLFSETQSSIIDKIKYVILDEAHYISDEQRGVVWEEILIAAPPNIKFIILTATLPNYYDLAMWLSIIRPGPVHCIYQKKRPIPLHIYAIDDNGSHKLLKEGEKTLDHLELSRICQNTNTSGSISENVILPRDPQAYEISNTANTIVSGGRFPLLIFCLSRRRCFKIAKHLNIDGNFDEIVDFFDSTFENLDPEIKNGSQYLKIRDLLSRGIGVHHSGIIPIIRETIEVLFSHGKLPVLVATETFALGVNAPARSVLFASLVKWGGSSFRAITSSEFLQMAGRAGRRGFDDHGDVFVYVAKGDSTEKIEKIIGSKPEKLVSRMRITTSLILSCIARGLDPHFFVRHSLLYFLHAREAPLLRKKLEKITQSTDTNENSSQDYMSEAVSIFKSNLQNKENEKIEKEMNSNECSELRRFIELLKFITDLSISRTLIKQSLPKGRLVYIIHDNKKWGWSVFNSIEHGTNITVYVCAKKDSNNHNVPSQTPRDSFIALLKLPISSIVAISTIITPNPETINGNSNVSSIFGAVTAVQRKYGHVPLLVLDNQFKNTTVENKISEFQQLEKSLISRNKNSDLIELCSSIQEQILIEQELSEMENPIPNRVIDLYYQILIHMKYLTSDGHSLDFKGKVALNFHVDDPLPIVELLFSNIFVELSIDQICIATSCFVESQPKIKSPETPFLIELWSRIQSKLSVLNDIIKKNNLAPFETPKKNVMYFVYRYLNTKVLSESAESTIGNCKLSEGVAVRILKRIRELLHQFEVAATFMGVDELSKKFHNAETYLNESSNFDSSLYQTDV